MVRNVMAIYGLLMIMSFVFLISFTGTDTLFRETNHSNAHHFEHVVSRVLRECSGDMGFVTFISLRITLCIHELVEICIAWTTIPERKTEHTQLPAIILYNPQNTFSLRTHDAFCGKCVIFKYSGMCIDNEISRTKRVW